MSAELAMTAAALEQEAHQLRQALEAADAVLRQLTDDTADYLDAPLPVITAKGPGHNTGRLWLRIQEARP